MMPEEMHNTGRFVIMTCGSWTNIRPRNFLTFRSLGFVNVRTIVEHESDCMASEHHSSPDELLSSLYLRVVQAEVVLR